jgi:urea transport system permease protein
MSATLAAPAPSGAGRMTLRLLLIAAVLILAMLPVLNRLPQDSAVYVSDFIVSITGKWITYAILALAIDLAWGYAGILSLGHGAFFALGGYAIGMHLMRLIGPRGVYGHPTMPDFMVFLGYQELPWYWPS